MTECTQKSFEFPACKRRVIEANFEGGDITTDGGVLLLRQVDSMLGLSEAIAGELLSLIHISEPTRLRRKSRMPSYA